MGSLRCASTALLVLLAGVLMFQPTKFTTDAGAAPSLLSLGNRAQVHSQSPSLKQSNLPLYFEANQGQTDGRVKFLSRGAGYSLFLTEDGATLSLRMPQADDAAHTADPGDSAAGRPDRGLRANAMLRGRRQSPTRYATDSVQLKLVAANPSPAVSGDSPQSGRVNYFLGKDPSRWHAGITTYKGVRYANVYPGVDMLFHGSQQELEYDFEVAPGADPSRIALRVNGARDLRLDLSGNAVVSTPVGDIALHKPVTYQGEGSSRTEIASNFELRPDGTLGFHVGHYDRSKELVIDPVLTYSTYLGGSDTGFIAGLVTNSSGNVFVAGQTTSADFPVTLGAFQPSLPNAESAFVTEFTPDGSSLVFSTFLGGTTGFNHGWDVDIDSDGNVYVTGETGASDFPVFSAFQSTRKGTSDVFLTALNPGGGSIRYSTYLGGKGSENGTGIRTGNPGKVYVTGTTYSTNFPTTANAFKTKLGSAGGNCFVAKFDTNKLGSASRIYSTYLGGSNAFDYDECSRIARDSKGDVFVTGNTASFDFPTTSGAYQTHLNGDQLDAFVSELNTTGTVLLHSTFLGGMEWEFGNDVRVDGSGNVYVTGESYSDDFPTKNGAFQRTKRGDSDAFVTKFNPTLSSLVYSTFVGGSGYESSYAIFLDSSQNAYIAGYTDSTDFPVLNPTQAHFHGGSNSNGFAFTLNSTGSALLFGTYMGGTGQSNCDTDIAYGVSVRNNTLYVGGLTCSLNFPVTPGAFQTTSSADGSGFVQAIGDVIP
jgi:Beta-propeller repeat